MLPVDLILVRHGQSEENKAISMSKVGDNSFFTSEFRKTHDREFRLTNLGVSQAKATGEWLAKNVPMPLDFFCVSDYIRTRETAYYLNLFQAHWEIKRELRERDQALMDVCPINLPELDRYRYVHDPFFSYPVGGGESFATLCLRLKIGFLNYLESEYPAKRGIGVCHGYVMRALQMELEDLGYEDFVKLNKSKEAPDRILNGQIHWYTRRDPDTLKVESSKMVAVRSVCVQGIVGDYGWRKIERRCHSNGDLIKGVRKYPLLNI